MVEAGLRSVGGPPKGRLPLEKGETNIPRPRFVLCYSRSDAPEGRIKEDIASLHKKKVAVEGKMGCADRASL